jgi:hypothetical protein
LSRFIGPRAKRLAGFVVLSRAVAAAKHRVTVFVVRALPFTRLHVRQLFGARFPCRQRPWPLLVVVGADTGHVELLSAQVPRGHTNRVYEVESSLRKRDPSCSDATLLGDVANDLKLFARRCV